MKTLAVLQCDLKQTPLGTRSRLAEEMGGAAILRRTVERVARVREISGIVVLSPGEQVERCARLLRGTRAEVRPCSGERPAWRGLVQAGRKWSLDGWRGGIGGTTHFDEFVDARSIRSVLRTKRAEAVLCVPPGAPLMDPMLGERMIRQHREAQGAVRLTFCQAPPGVAGIVLDAALVDELAEKGIPIGWIFNYKPDSPQRDLIFQASCCEVPVEIRHAVGRLTTDTRRSTERAAALLQAIEEPTLAQIGAWLSRREDSEVEPLPREVEIELTTEDPYPDSLLRPRGSRVPPRGPMDARLVGRIVESVIDYDDALVVLGGFGDPLRHPEFREILGAIRSVGGEGEALYGLAVRTSGADLAEETIGAIIEHEVDVLNVVLDAWTPELYGRLHSPNTPAHAELTGVVNGIERLSSARQSVGSARPLLVPELTKAKDNVGELDDFHDGWLRRVGAVAISGCSHYAGQCENRGVINMAPSPRVACRRLRSRCMVLADGRVTTCDQDFKGLQSVGRMGEATLAELWRGDAFERVRASHREGLFDANALCARCDEWHRP